MDVSSLRTAIPRYCRGDMTAEMSAHAMAMQGRHGKIDFTLLRRGDLLQELLLREGVAIVNLPVILEGIADFASLSKNPDDLSELVRSAGAKRQAAGGS